MASFIFDSAWRRSGSLRDPSAGCRRLFDGSCASARLLQLEVDKVDAINRGGPRSETRNRRPIFGPSVGRDRCARRRRQL